MTLSEKGRENSPKLDISDTISRAECPTAEARRGGGRSKSGNDLTRGAAGDALSQKRVGPVAAAVTFGAPSRQLSQWPHGRGRVSPK